MTRTRRLLTFLEYCELMERKKHQKGKKDTKHDHDRDIDTGVPVVTQQNTTTPGTTSSLMQVTDTFVGEPSRTP